MTWNVVFTWGSKEVLVKCSDIVQTVEGFLKTKVPYYNAVVRDFNTKIGQVPSNIVANAFNFSKKEFFEIDEAEKEVPKVDFGN